MPAYEVPVRFTVNDRQFQGALKKSREELNRLGEEYDEIVAAQKRKTQQDDKLVRGNKQLFAANAKALRQTGVISKETEKVAKQYLAAQEALRQYRRELQALEKAGLSTGKQAAQYEAVTKKIKLQEDAIEQLNRDNAVAIEQADRLRKSKTGVAAAFNKAGTEGKWLTGIVNDVSMKLFVLTFAGKQVFDTLINGFVKTGEEVLLFETRVRSLTGSVEAVGPLFEMVNRLGIGFQDAAQAFTRFAVANTTMERTNKELVQMTETVLSFGLAAGGSIQEVTAGLQQLSQGLASNRLQGDELRSVFENLPLVAKALADELAGGSIAALREMGAQGQLTGDVVSEALLKATEEAKRLAEALPDTTERAANRVANAWSKAISEILKAVGGTSGVTEAYNSLARTIADFASFVQRNGEIVKDVVEAMGVAFITLFAGVAVQQIGLVIGALGKLVVATKNAAAAMVALEGAARKQKYLELASALGRPGVAVAAGLAMGAIVLLTKAFKDSRLETDAYTRSLEENIAALEKMDVRASRAIVAQTERAIAGQAELIQKTQEEIRAIEERDGKIRGGQAARDNQTKTLENLSIELAEQNAKMAELARLHQAATGRVAEFEGEAKKAQATASDLKEEVDRLTESQERGLQVLERLNPEIKLYNEYLEDTDALFDLMNAGNAEDVFDALDKLHGEYERGVRELKGYNSATEESAAAAFKNWNIIADPRVDDELRKRIATMIEMEGIQGKINSGFREYAEQVRLYQKYLAGGPLAAKPGTSLHESGDALDLVATNKKITKELAEQYGLRVLLYENSKHVHLELAKEEKAHKRNTSASKALTDAERERAKAIKDAAEEERKANATRDRGLLTLKEYMEALRQEAEASKLSASEKARNRVETDLKTRADKLALRAKVEEEKGNKKLAAAIREVEQANRDAIPEAQRLAEVAAKQGEAAESLAEMWKGAMREIGESIQEVLSEAIREGKLSMQKFADVILDTLAELAAAVLQKKIVIPIVGAAMGAVGLGGMAGELGLPTGGSGGGFGGLGQLFGGGQAADGLSKIPVLGDAVSGLGAAITSLSAGTTSLGAATAGSQAAMLAAQTGTFGASGAAATAGALGGSGALAGLGSMAASALPFVGPALALGAASGLFDGLFGGEEKPPLARIGQTAGEFALTDTRTMDAAQAEQVREQVEALNTYLDEVEQALGESASAARDTLAAWSGGQALSPEQIEDWLADASRQVTERMIQAFEAGEVAAAGSGVYGQILADSLQAAADSPEAMLAAVQTAQALYRQVGAAAEQLGVSEQVALELVQLSGGYQALSQAHQRYLGVVETEQERMERIGGQLAGALQPLGVEVPRTRDELEALVGGLDLTTQSGRETYAAIMAMIDPLSQFVAEAEDAARRLNAANQQFYDQALELFYSDAEQARIAAQRAAQRAGTVGGLDLTNYSSQSDFSRTIRSLPDRGFGPGEAELQALIRSQGGDFNAYLQSVDAYFSALEQLDRLQQQSTRTVQRTASTTSTASDAADDLAREQEELRAETARLELELLRLQDPVAAVAEERRREMQALNAANRPLQERIYQLEDERDAAEEAVRAAEEQAAAAERLREETQALELELLRLSDPQAALAEERRREMAELDASNRVLQQRIYELEDARDAAQAAAEAEADLQRQRERIADEREQLERELLRVTDTEEARAELRRRELQDLDASNRALQEQIWLIEDARAAREEEAAAIREQISDTYERVTDAARANAEAQREALAAQYDTRLEAYQSELEAARDFAAELESISGIITSALDALGPPTAEIARIERARAARDLSNLAASGGLPGEDRLREITAALTGTPGLYQSQGAQIIGESAIQSDLETLLGRADHRASSAQQSVERLEEQLDLLSSWRDDQEAWIETALEQQIAQADAWRDAEIERLDALSANLDESLPDLRPLRAVSEEAVGQREDMLSAQRDVVAEQKATQAAIQQTADLLLAALQRIEKLQKRAANAAEREAFITEQAS
jgi:tape measure domain-containing protein